MNQSTEEVLIALEAATKRILYEDPQAAAAMLRAAAELKRLSAPAIVGDDALFPTTVDRRFDPDRRTTRPRRRVLNFVEADARAAAIAEAARERHEPAPYALTDTVIDAPRSILSGIDMGIRTTALLRAHVRHCGDSIAAWPYWAKDESLTLTKSGAAALIWTVMEAARLAEPAVPKEQE